MVGLFDGWMVDAFYERMLSLKRDLLAAHSSKLGAIAFDCPVESFSS